MIIRKCLGWVPWDPISPRHNCSLHPCPPHPLGEQQKSTFRKTEATLNVVTSKFCVYLWKKLHRICEKFCVLFVSSHTDPMPSASFMEMWNHQNPLEGSQEDRTHSEGVFGKDKSRFLIHFISTHAYFGEWWLWIYKKKKGKKINLLQSWHNGRNLPRVV